MGLVICPKHGNGFMFVCPHICAAVDGGEPCHGIEHHAVDYSDADPDLDIELECWFCPKCIQVLGLSVNGRNERMADGEDFVNRTAGLYRPMCPVCFNDWRERRLG